jgi:FtsH-binding integral membrane protein
MAVEALGLTYAETQERSLITRVYAWMSVGLIITAIVSMLVASSPDLTQMIVGTKGVFYGLLISELLLVLAFGWLIRAVPASVATLMFLVYAVLNGLTLSVIFLAFTAASIASTFFVTAGTFGAMSAYGYFTKRDLSSIGNLCFMGLIGIIIASVVNLFMGSAVIYWATTFIGVLVFTGLTAYDTQRLKSMNARGGADAEMIRKGAIMGALMLYLDFINLFLLLLRFMGRRK